jgi:hypothetical protein
MLLGACIGLIVGIFWAMIFGPLTDGPPSIKLSFLIYTTSFAATGIIVGAFQRKPVLVGNIAGLLILSTWAVACNVGDSCCGGPWSLDPWVVIWLIALGGSGLFWGGVIGTIFWCLINVGRKSAHFLDPQCSNSKTGILNISTESRNDV